MHVRIRRVIVVDRHQTLGYRRFEVVSRRSCFSPAALGMMQRNVDCRAAIAVYTTRHDAGVLVL